MGSAINVYAMFDRRDPAAHEWIKRLISGGARLSREREWILGCAKKGLGTVAARCVLQDQPPFGLGTYTPARQVSW